MERLHKLEDAEVYLEISPDTVPIEYTPKEIDYYKVIVKSVDDWEEIHNYIVNENEIDGIPNRKIECSNIEEYSLRSSVYTMSIEEADILRTHSKVEDVILDPSLYPQPQSLFTLRYNKDVAFNKPGFTAGAFFTNNYITSTITNGVRSNWGHLFVNNPSSEPFRGVGIASTTIVDTDINYNITGSGVDCVIIDSGVTPLHPEFKNQDGSTRVKDLILDGPYKVDPSYFDSNNLTYTKIVDGVNIGVGIATTAAHSWWSNTSARSPEFSSLGTVSITSLYTLGHTATKTSNSDNNQLIDGHGTACASQIGGKSFGLAFECNLWGIRIALGGAGGYLDASVGLNACAIFHNAKKISQSGDPDPTLINNSYGFTSSTGNTNGTTYTHGYRGQTLTYTGNGSNTTPPSNSGACRNHKYFTYNDNGTSSYLGYTGTGQYIPPSSGATTNSAAENAIAAGCIVVASAGNNNQKLSDSTDVDYDNWYSFSTNYINRVGGVQKGHSTTDSRKVGTIRVGALDCAVEPADSKQGSTPYAIRRVAYSANGPMINVWAPAEMTMAAGYVGSYEDYQREDDSNFYDTFFNGTSSAGPNACSVIALHLQQNRTATQSDVHDWLETNGTKQIDMSDPYSDPNEDGYWSLAYNASTDEPGLGDSYNFRGNSNLRGAPNRVLYNPYGTIGSPRISGVAFSGITFSVV